MEIMVSLKLLSYLFFINLTLISHHKGNAQQSVLKFSCSNTTSSNTYQTNLNTLLLNISSNTEIDYGFYNFSYGENANKVNAIALCRGDVTPQDCRTCLTESTSLLPLLCHNKKEAIQWYDNCIIRYSNRSIFGIMEKSPYLYMWNPEVALQANEFKQVLLELLGTLRITAASGNSRRKFATAKASGPSNQTIYGLVQCTPDLSNEECNVCLDGAISEIPICCDQKRGGRVIRPSCNFRYETYSFFQTDEDDDAPAPPYLPPLSPPLLSADPMSEKGKSNKSRVVVAIVVPIIVASIALLILSFIYLRVEMPRKCTETEATDEISTSDLLQLDFETIRVATNDFSDANKLGQGGFGLVYMGRLYNGQQVAVKRLSRDSSQGDREFKNEVLLMAKLQHRNLVQLLGFCLENRERLLVYEFVPNKSLDYFIFDPIKREQLNWKSRYNIIEGIARGLLYLHHDSRVQIIHRDLKTSNILLDEEMNPKISDFGLAKLFVMDQTQGNTNTIVGTYGYMAPEYIKHGYFSMKSDVFSFGVLILEIVSGQKNGEFHDEENVEHLVSASWKNWREGTISKLVDPTLTDEGSSSEIMRCIHIGLLCVQDNVGERPTMASIAPMLSSYSFTLPIPSKPAFYLYTSLPAILSWPRCQYVEGSINEVSISEQYPR